LPDCDKPRECLLVALEGYKEDIEEQEKLENGIAKEENQYGGSEALRFLVIEEIAGVDELAGINDSLGDKSI